MSIGELFSQTREVFSFFREFFSVVPTEVRLVFFYMFGILMFFGIYFMFRK